MKETTKITISCFIGGAFCCTIALILAPTYWWLGIIAGIAGGYIAYEFTFYKFIHFISQTWNDATAKTKKWFSDPHPVLYPSIIISILLWTYVLIHCDVTLITSQDLRDHAWPIRVLFPVLFASELFVIAVVLFFLALSFLFDIGDSVKELLKGEDKYSIYVSNYYYVIVGVAKIIRIILYFLGWTIWKYLIIALLITTCCAWELICQALKLAVKLIQMKQVICAIDGALGGTISYIWLIAPAMSLSEQTTLVIFGGILGATIGTLHWKIVQQIKS